MIHQFILEFADYLNQNGYAVSSEKISRIFVMMGEDTDITNEQEIIPVMQTVFCTSHLQSDMLPEYFHTFLRYHQQILDAKDSEKKMEDLQSARSSVEREIDKVQKSGKQKIQEIKERKARTEEEIRKKIEEEERAKMTGALSDSDKKSVSKIEKDIKSIKNATVS